MEGCRLRWYGHVSHSSGLAKTIQQGTVKGGRRQGRQRKRWEDNIREWTGLEFGKSQRAVENSGCKIICGAPTTLTVKGLMMMMMRRKEDSKRSTQRRDTEGQMGKPTDKTGKQSTLTSVAQTRWQGHRADQQKSTDR